MRGVFIYKYQLAGCDFISQIHKMLKYSYASANTPITIADNHFEFLFSFSFRRSY
jgi:hypothetical protein